MLSFDRFTVKHGTQNIQNDCHQWLFGSIRAHQIRFRPGTLPGPYCGSLRRSPDPLAGARGRGEEGYGKRREEGETTGTGATRPPFADSWICPWCLRVFKMADTNGSSNISRCYFISSTHDKCMYANSVRQLVTHQTDQKGWKPKVVLVNDDVAVAYCRYIGRMCIALRTSSFWIWNNDSIGKYSYFPHHFRLLPAILYIR